MTNILEIPRHGQKTTLPAVPYSALALWLKDRLPEQKLIILTPDVEHAQQQLCAWTFFAPNKKIQFLPDWETLPYEHLSPHKELVSERLTILWQLLHQEIDILIVPIATAMQKICPPSFLLGHSFNVCVGQQLNIEQLRENLVKSGYQNVSNVMERGEFAIRGGLLDIFPMGANIAYRIDLFHDEIETIRTFDPYTQRSIQKIENIHLFPANEFPTDKKNITLFRQRFREEIEGDPAKATPYNMVTEENFGRGIEYYLPLFFEDGCVPLMDYFSQDSCIIYPDTLPQIAKKAYEDILIQYQSAQYDLQYPPLKPSLLYLADNDFQAYLKQFPRFTLPQENVTEYTLPNIKIEHTEPVLKNLLNFQQAFSGRILIVAQSMGRRETMYSFFKQYGLDIFLIDSFEDFLQSQADICLCSGGYISGFKLPEEQIAVVGEVDLHQYTAPQRYSKQRKNNPINPDNLLKDLLEIRIDDLVVHEQYGIGRYKGLVNTNSSDGEEEMMLLEYADNALLYIPITRLYTISRYTGTTSPEHVTLHRLGGKRWIKEKQKALEKANDTAAELLHLYAQRTSRKGFACTFDPIAYNAFADGFGYEPTPDQQSAINAVIQDLLSEKPMDRLVCGDVGFGKTEVALRASFITAMSGRQVALLAPTTLLVEQHAQVFRERFANFPIKVAQLSRFSQSKHTKETIEGMENGTIDIVIGTHKIIQSHIKFKRLGLVIIDEEHRFGVSQKERLKKLRTEVDILTLTATPIPRTLNMALDKLRDLSIISTAPSRRLAVKTFVKPFSKAIIREAVLRELKRGGQVFFLHNEVNTIDHMRIQLEELLPEAHIAVAHGQLPGHELERIMRQFLQQQFNVLLCSTIIETGIDIPNANTIIINRANQLGLAQLHQLRGRVGRSHHQAYAYLLTPEKISTDAQRRLTAIEEADGLGAGFHLAMYDLEIRGAGEILGDDQSGEMAHVGLDLYTKMLQKAIIDLKQGKITSNGSNEIINKVTEINLHSPALLPDTYCSDIHQRLVLYNRLSACEDKHTINQIREELIDRFGLPVEPVQTLLETHYLRILAQQYGIEKIDATDKRIILTLTAHHHLNTSKLIELIQKQHTVYQLLGQNSLKMITQNETVEQRIQAIYKLINELK